MLLHNLTDMNLVTERSLLHKETSRFYMLTRLDKEKSCARGPYDKENAPTNTLFNMKSSYIIGI
eukprot:6228545-Amphidinium_carterae.1